MRDIVERLRLVVREWGLPSDYRGAVPGYFTEAADEIERLRKQVDELYEEYEEALTEIERLRTKVEERQVENVGLHAEVERLRAERQGWRTLLAIAQDVTVSAERDTGIAGRLRAALAETEKP